MYFYLNIPPTKPVLLLLADRIEVLMVNCFGKTDGVYMIRG